MRDVILVLFDDHAAADRARTDFVASGFPTDRVSLTSQADPGLAATGPEGGLRANLRDYFSTLFEHDAGDTRPDDLAAAVIDGRAVLAIHPRGTVEIEQADDILDRHEPLEIVRLLTPPAKRSGVLGEHAAGRS